MKIYTRKGDTGTTQLIGGSRVPKHHIRIEAYGTVDELNSWIGVISVSFESDKKTEQTLIAIQDNLFTIGSMLATQAGYDKMKLPEIGETDVELLEKEIDRMNDHLTPLSNFLLPGGDATNANTHVTRCVCRRAERCVTHLNEAEEVPAIVIKYLNRLSDYLFTLARWTSRINGAKEIAWKPRV